MILFELFLSFVKIGFTSFGGMSMIPLILEEMTAHNWMTAQDLSNLIAIAEMTPGPLGVNCATFAGTQTAGFIGGLVAVLGVLSPTLTLTLAVGFFYQKFRKSNVMKRIMLVVKPVCVAMIIGVMISLSLENYQTAGSVDFIAIAIGLVALALLKKWKWSIPKVIMTSAALGIACFGVLGKLLGA